MLFVRYSRILSIVLNFFAFAVPQDFQPSSPSSALASLPCPRYIHPFSRPFIYRVPVAVLYPSALPCPALPSPY